MALPTEAGRYLAKPQGWGVGQSTGGAVEFAVDFSLLDFLNPQSGEWEDVRMEAPSITGYFYPIDKEGKAAQKTVSRLKEVFGWSGASLAELNDGDWSAVECQVTLEWDEYNGKRKLKVAWLNSRDWTGGGVSKGDPAKVQGLDARFGAQLRALGGGAPKTAPTMKPQAADPNATAADAAKKKAWAAYKAKFPNSPNDEVAEGFRQAFAKYFPGRKPELTSAADWDRFTADGFEKPVPVSPIGEEVEFKESDIPF